MAERIELELRPGVAAHAVALDEGDSLAAAVRSLDLPELRVAVVVVGGAARMSDEDVERARPAVRDVLAPFVAASDGVIVDGGTDTGVFRLIGRERAAGSHTFPLVGVLPARLAALPGHRAEGDAAPLEPNHTHFLLAPGSAWGDEVLWLAHAAGRLATGGRAVTVLVNGGTVAWDDLEASVAAGRPVVVLAGSGRAANELAAGLAGAPSSPRVTKLVASGLLHRVDVDDAEGLASLLQRLLEAEDGAPEERG
jgi:hypothetical protein